MDEVEYHEDTLIDKSDDEYDEDQFDGEEHPCRVAVEADKIWLNHTQMSGQVDKLFTAMAKAQGEMGHAAKTEENEFYGSKYADLAACFEAVRQPMFMNGLCIIQSPAGGIGREATEESDYDSFPATVCLDTVIGHVSGQWISSSLTMRLVRDDPHGVGSAITYARRYALTSMLGVAQADDDGNAATIPAEAPAKKKPAKKKAAKKKDKPPIPSPFLMILNRTLKEVGCSNKEEADLVCAWLFDDHSLTVDMCRDSETSSQAFSARVDEVVATGISLDEFLTRAAVWRDGTQEEATT
jgi:hypothetical protein